MSSVENEKKVLQKNKKNKDLRLYIGKQSQLESFIKNIENKKERKIELEESTFLTSDYTTKLQLSIQYGTDTNREI